MNKRIIIRDDDTSYFTQPFQLEKIYGTLWDQGYPVCLSVIPAHRADVRVDHRPGKPYDPCIPPEYRGQSNEYPIVENPILCDFLNKKVEQGLVEICLHGYSHTYMEFTSEDANFIKDKLQHGYSLLQQAFPNTKIKTFISPYDQISPIALELVFEMGLNICVASQNFKGLSQYQHISAYQHHTITERQIYTCDEYLFTHREDPNSCLSNARLRLQTQNLLIVANHYWTFYNDWAGDNLALQRNWGAFVEDIISNKADIVTFSG